METGKDGWKAKEGRKNGGKDGWTQGMRYNRKIKVVKIGNKGRGEERKDDTRKEGKKYTRLE